MGKGAGVVTVYFVHPPSHSLLVSFQLTIHARTQKYLFFNTCNQNLLRQSHK